MAVGKGSMERAAKALETQKATNTTKKNTQEKKMRQSVSVPSKQVMDIIVDKNGSGQEENKGKSNGQYQIGQEIPIYYL